MEHMKETWLMVTLGVLVSVGFFLLAVSYLQPTSQNLVTGNVVYQPVEVVEQFATPEPTLSCEELGRGRVLADDGLYQTHCGSSTTLRVVSCTGSGKVSFTSFRCPSGTFCQDAQCS